MRALAFLLALGVAIAPAQAGGPWGRDSNYNQNVASGGGGGSYALVSGQIAQGSSTTGGFTTYNAVLPNNPTPGNLVVAMWVYNAGSTGLGASAFSVKDGAGTPNVYTHTTISPFGGSLPYYSYAAVYWFIATATANKTITFTTTDGTATAGSMWVAEFSGNAASSPLDIDGANLGSASTAMTTPSITTTVSGDLLVGIGIASHTLSHSNSPWTGIGTIFAGVSGFVGAYAEYYIQPSSGAQGINFTQSTSDPYVGLAAAFKP